MGIIFKYISISFLKIFGICVASTLTIYLVIDFMSRAGKLGAKGLSTIDIAGYFIFKVPLILTQVTPMSTLLATLLTLAVLTKNNEVTAIKSCGISIYYISLPILAISFFITLFTLASNELVVPYSNKRYKEMERNETGNNRDLRLFKKDKIWYFGQSRFYKIDLIDMSNKTLHGVTTFKLGQDYRVEERIDAKKAEWLEDHWNFKQGIIRLFKNGRISVETFREKKFTFAETFSDFTVTVKTPEEMNFRELKTHIAKLSKMGLDYNLEMVDLLSKISFPLINIILPLIGIPFALKTGRIASIASGVGISIAIGFVYWIAMAFNISLGHAGALPPFLAAFGSNIIFALVGIIFIMSAET